MKVLLSNCRVQVFLLQRYNKKQLFAIVCSDFMLKSAHIFNFYTEYQEVTKHKKMTRLAHTVSKTGKRLRVYTLHNSKKAVTAD